MSIEPLITEHLDIWTAADTEKKSGRGRSSGNAGNVYGIKKLRELILELAVRGKLVPQDTSDEPASEHLQNINRELCSLINVPSLPLLRRDKSTIDPESYHFTLPSSWLWCELQNIAIFENGKAHEQYVVEKEAFVLVNSSYISTNGGKIKYVSNRLSPLSKDDIAIVMSDVPSGRALVRCFLVTDSDNFTLNQRIGALKTGSTLSKQYLLMVLDRNKYYLQYDDGKKQSNLKKIQILSCPIPLPPLAEQHRIVAKVDELMALCDQLENQHNNATEAHEKLVTHLLGTLTQSQNAEDFNNHWQRIYEHFDTLFTTEASIDALKQTLLQLAVMGKLVPQDPNDEPASELIKHLHTDRSTWLSENQHSNPECKSMQKKLAALPNAEAPFILPSSWAAVHLIDCCRLLVDCHNKTAPYSSSGIPIIRTSNIRERKFRLEDLKYVSEDTYQFWSRRCFPESGDIMFTREAPMGEAAIIPLGAKYCLGQRTMLIRPMHEFIFNEYLLITLTEPHLLERSSDSAIGSTVKHLRVGAVEELNIPLPPLAEQHRIVSRVDALMAICDQLKSQIISGNQLQQKLADVVIEQAIN